MAEVRLVVDLAHPPARVWRALTDARLLGEWFVPTDLEPREGGTFTLQADGIGGFPEQVIGELTELVPEQRLVMLWQGEKLHTRVVWELTGTAEGCQVRVVQSGFIGAPAALRRRALRATYAEQFSGRLPGVLDRLAAADADADAVADADLPEPAAVAGRPAVPRQRQRQRQGSASATVGAWFAGQVMDGQTMEPAGSAGGGATHATAVAGPVAASVTPPIPPAPGPADFDLPAPDSPAPETPAMAQQAAARQELSSDQPVRAQTTPERRPRALLAPWGRRLAVVPGWGRAVAVGIAAAVLAVAVLAGITHTSPPPVGADGQPAGQGGARAGLGTGVQPGTGGSRSSDPDVPPEEASAGQHGEAPPAVDPSADPAPGAPDPAAPDPAGAGSGGGTAPGEPESPEATAGPGNPPPPELTAQLSTGPSGLLGLNGREVTVTVANPGPGVADAWTVTMDVGDQSVTNVSGAVYTREGTVATFTSDSDLAAGGSAPFSFHIPSSGLLGLGGANDPTGCTIDGRPCTS